MEKADGCGLLVRGALAGQPVAPSFTTYNLNVTLPTRLGLFSVAAHKEEAIHRYSLGASYS
jgi:hypothetical protein